MISRISCLGLASILLVSCSGSQSAQPAPQAAPAEKPAAAPSAPQSTPAAAPTSSQTPEAPPPDAPRAPAAPKAPKPPAEDASQPAAATSAAAASQPPAAPAPTFREVTIPAGTSLSVKLLTAVASDTSKVEDPVRGTLTRPLVIAGTTAAPVGTELVGTVTSVKRSGRVQGRATVAFRFDRLILGPETHRIQTANVTRQAAASTKQDVKKGGLGAGAGAIIGGIAGGGKGAAIGAIVGGTGTVMATRGQEVRVPAGTIVTTRLQDAVTVTVSTGK
jgi:hypothetical protein